MALAWARAGAWLDEWKGRPMTMPYADGDGPLIPRPELTLPDLRQAVAAVVPSRLAMVFLEGAAYAGPGPGVRTGSRGLLMLTYLTDGRPR